MSEEPRVCLPTGDYGAGPFGTVRRPVVPVALRSPVTGRRVHTAALVDTGCDFTQAQIGLLSELGVGWQDAECQFDRLNNGHSLTYRAPIDLTIADVFTIRFDSMQFRGLQAWGASDNARLTLGSNDMLRFLKLTIDYDELTLEPRRPGETEWAMPHDVLEPAVSPGRAA